MISLFPVSQTIKGKFYIFNLLSGFLINQIASSKILFCDEIFAEICLKFSLWCFSYQISHFFFPLLGWKRTMPFAVWRTELTTLFRLGTFLRSLIRLRIQNLWRVLRKKKFRIVFEFELQMVGEVIGQLLLGMRRIKFRIKGLWTIWYLMLNQV